MLSRFLIPGKLFVGRRTHVLEVMAETKSAQSNRMVGCITSSPPRSTPATKKRERTFTFPVHLAEVVEEEEEIMSPLVNARRWLV